MRPDKIPHLLPLLLLCSAIFNIISARTEMIQPGGDWRDTEGKLIVATEGGIIQVDGLYYLWGMDRSNNNYTFEGVNLYSSSDLKNWTFVNRILDRTSHQDLDGGAVIERAKILHNVKTGQFVMWMHFEGHNAYKTAEVAYAVSNSIGGNYQFKSHFRPMGIDSRDINVYQDDDGKAYLICTTEGNQSVSLFELDEAYTGIVREVYRGSASNDMECEGHAIIKTGGYYFWLMSWCTGWDFNDNHYFYAPSLGGPWKAGGNIATSTTHTYESQVGFAVTVRGSAVTSFLYTGDRWAVSNFSMSRVVLLPIEVNGTSLSVRWNDQWDIDVQTGEWHAGSRNFINGVYKITAKHSGMVLGTNGSAVQQQKYTGAASQLWRIQNIGASHFKISSVASGKVMDISGASREEGAKLLQYDWADAYNQKWHVLDCGGGYHRLVNVNTLGKALEIKNESRAEGADAVLCSFSYKDNQLFRLELVDKNLVSGSTYMIENRGTGKVIGAGAGGDVTLGTPAGTVDQVWRAGDLFNGYFTFTLAGEHHALDNANSSKNGTQMRCEVFDTCFAQQWQPVHITGGYYKLINRLSGKVLDNKDGSSIDGNPIIQYSDYASDNYNQQWKFVPAEAVGVNRAVKKAEWSPSEVIIYDLRGRVAGNGLKKPVKAGFVPGVYLVGLEKGKKILGCRVFMK